MPDPDREPTDDDRADAAYQRGFDAGRDGFRLIESALTVLLADIDMGPPGSLEHRAIQDARVQAAALISRVFRSEPAPA